MNKPSPTHDKSSAPESPSELPLIEFVAQGSFSIHNPESSRNIQSWEAADFTLGQYTELIQADDMQAVRRHSLALMQQAQDSLCIYSTDLEPWLYNHNCILEACRTLLLKHPKKNLRILLLDSSRIVREGHVLLALSRRLSSRCSIRKVNVEHDYSPDAWLIADNCGALVRKAQHQHQAVVYYQHPARVREIQHAFNAMWDVSLSDVNLRSMTL